uniref:Uncharacterized protein n=1 Tax=viral metagenome TaxID=1070528 RepID=A0A6C0B2S8_9ZZZZ
MAFPTSNLSLSSVCSAYSVAPASMNGLRGKTCYDPSNNPTTVPATGPFQLLATFGGKTVLPGVFTLDPQDAEDGPTPGPNGFGTLDGHVGFNNATYTMSNGKVTSLTLTFYANNTGNIGSIQGFTAQILADGASVGSYTNPGTYTASMNATSTVEIDAQFDIVEDPLAVNPQLQIQYNVTPSGLQ